MKDFLTRAFALTFVGSIHKNLDAPKAIGMGSPFRSSTEALRCSVTCYRADGHIALRTHRECGETSDKYPDPSQVDGSAGNRICSGWC